MEEFEENAQNRGEGAPSVVSREDDEPTPENPIELSPIRVAMREEDETGGEPPRLSVPPQLPPQPEALEVIQEESPESREPLQDDIFQGGETTAEEETVEMATAHAQTIQPEEPITQLLPEEPERQSVPEEPPNQESLLVAPPIPTEMEVDEPSVVAHTPEEKRQGGSTNRNFFKKGWNSKDPFTQPVHIPETPSKESPTLPTTSCSPLSDDSNDGVATRSNARLRKGTARRSRGRMNSDVPAIDLGEVPVIEIPLYKSPSSHSPTMFTETQFLATLNKLVDSVSVIGQMGKPDLQALQEKLAALTAEASKKEQEQAKETVRRPSTRRMTSKQGY